MAKPIDANSIANGFVKLYSGLEMVSSNTGKSINGSIIPPTSNPEVNNIAMKTGVLSGVTPIHRIFPHLMSMYAINA
tara:strand:+ start:301 stop:531 length:231 start_codon:yes stop_codon:yes gene_type:complete